LEFFVKLQREAQNRLRLGEILLLGQQASQLRKHLEEPWVCRAEGFLFDLNDSAIDELGGCEVLFLPMQFGKRVERTDENGIIIR